MFRTMTLATMVFGMVAASAGEAKAEVKVLPSVTGSGVTIGIKLGTYPAPGYGYPVYPGYPGYYPPVVYPTPVYYPPVVYPTPVYYPPVVYPTPVAKVFTVWVRGSVHEPWRPYGSYYSHSLAHEMADSLKLYGYHAKVIH